MGILAAFTKHPGSDPMNAGAADVVMCQVRFMKHLLFFLNTVEFWPLVSCPAGCYLSWDVPGLQLFCRRSRVSTCHMGINSQSSCFAHLYFLVPTGSDSCCLRQKVKHKTDWFEFKPCPSRQYEHICKESLCRYCFRLPFCGYFILVLQVKISSYRYSLVSITFALFFFF